MPLRFKRTNIEPRQCVHRVHRRRYCSPLRANNGMNQGVGRYVARSAGTGNLDAHRRPDGRRGMYVWTTSPHTAVGTYVRHHI